MHDECVSGEVKAIIIWSCVGATQTRWSKWRCGSACERYIYSANCRSEHECTVCIDNANVAWSAKVFSEQIYNANGKEWRKKIEFYWKVQPTVPEDNSIMQIQSSIFTFIVRAVCNEYFCAFFLRCRRCKCISSWWCNLIIAAAVDVEEDCNTVFFIHIIMEKGRIVCGESNPCICPQFILYFFNLLWELHRMSRVS